MSEAQAATDGQQVALPPAITTEPAKAETVEHPTGSKPRLEPLTRRELPERTQEKTEVKTQEKPEKPANGYQGPVDLSGLPEDVRAPIEARFAHLSRLMKKNELKSTSELSEWRKVAAEQSKIIEELQSGVGQVVDHLQDKSLNDAEAKIEERLAAAHEAGDTKAFIAAQKDLAKLEAKKLLLDEKKKAAPVKEVKQEQKPQNYRSASEMADAATADGELGSEDATAVSAWQDEKDTNGNLLRPWAHTKNPDNPTNDPLYRRALIESAAVFDESSPWANKTITEKLAEVDRRMGLQRSSATQTVLGGSLTSARKGTKIALTSNQEQIAIKTKFAGPKATDAQHLEAYRKQVERHNSTKGTRK